MYKKAAQIADLMTGEGVAADLKVLRDARKAGSQRQRFLALITKENLSRDHVSNMSQLRDLAQSAARIFSWDSDKGASVTNNTLVVTTEQLQQMRELCDADEPYKEPAISEADAITTEE